MTIRQVIELAKTSELSSLGIVNKDDVILGYLNLGMLELYKRFNLKVEEWLVTLVDGVEIYTAPADYMWIVSAYGEVPISSNELVNILPVNEEDNPLSINTVSWNKVQIPNSIDGAYVSIIYVASPTYYTLGDLDNEIDIPVQMVDALLAYIGYKANTSVDSGVQTEDSVWYIRYEKACNLLEQRSMVNSNDMYMNERIDMRGFV